MPPFVLIADANCRLVNALVTRITMKTSTLFAPTLVLLLACSASAQVKPVSTPGNSPAAAVNMTPGNTTRARVLSKDATASATDTSSKPMLQAHASSDRNDSSETARLRRTSKPEKTTDTVALQPAANTLRNVGAANSPSTPVILPPVSPASTQVYRVGALDVLDIQLTGNPSRESTLFTVREGGLVEYPLAGAPISAAGLTTSEIANVLKQQIKIIENPKLEVTVRDYASHQVMITGFVGAPGKKSLRREAVPLYALLAEALVLPEAARATITRQGRPTVVADLKDSNHAATLVVAGDVIKVSGVPAIPTEFFFIGGAINSPGQKPFHAGITLTQAILASGGASTKATDRIRVSRLGANGRLTAEEHNLRRIQTGKVADPVLQKGDRIEVLSIN
jgi:protein involved in polysaccharide export with SLBB domain